MNVTPIKTRLVHANECRLEDIIGESIKALPEHSVVVITSKIVSLCQNRIVSKDSITKSDLIHQEADYYTPHDFNPLGYNFTIKNNTILASAGIDESNVDGAFLLWPADVQQVANDIRRYLCQQFNVQDVGVIITDSACMLISRAGTIGVMIAHSGFTALKYLAGTKDLFGQPFKVTRSATGSGLAAAATVAMGEGAEQTPLAIITDIPFVMFTSTDPTAEDIEATYISPERDFYARFLTSAPWQKGGGGLDK